MTKSRVTKSRVYTIAAALLFTASVAAPTWGQTTPDFSGTWRFDAAKSTGEPVIPRHLEPLGIKPSDPTLIIEQTPTELAVTIGDLGLLYMLDGTQNNISATGIPGFPRGKAVWEKGRLVITLTQEGYDATKGEYVRTPGKEIYSLSGNTLTIDKSQTLLDGTVETRKLVYTKSSLSGDGGSIPVIRRSPVAA